MPPRWACIAIVGFWLAVNGWLLYRDVVPRLLPDQPPPYSVDLLEEAKIRRPEILWTVKQNGKHVLTARTSIRHPSRDTFEMAARYRPAAGRDAVSVPPFALRQMSSTYRVSTAGDLQGVSVRLEGALELSPVLQKLLGNRGQVDATLSIDAEAQGGEFVPAVQLAVPGVKTLKVDLPAVQARAGGAILLPLHPVNRLRGLSPGQTWTMTVFDPIHDALSALPGGVEKSRVVRCRVRDRAEPLEEGHRQGKQCLVIDYEGEDFTGETWVAVDTEQVVAQIAVLGKKNHWAMYRD